MSRIKISGDSTIDLSPELLQKYDVDLVPLYINMGEDSYKDGVSIMPEKIYSYVEKTGVLPKTSAPSIEDYLEFFRAQREKYDEVIHFNISSEFSSAHQNALIAAEEVGGIYPVDSRNLSSGTGLLALEACELAADTDLSAAEIVEKVSPLISKVETSFIINQLDYLYKGGRCSGLVALGANLLHLRPVILVREGKMEVGKKFRGSYNDCMVKYIESKLANRNDIRNKRVFVTHTQCPKETVDLAIQTIQRFYPFNEILDTDASCTITNHCGAGTLGILFICQ